MKLTTQNMTTTAQNMTTTTLQSTPTMTTTVKGACISQKTVQVIFYLVEHFNRTDEIVAIYHILIFYHTHVQFLSTCRFDIFEIYHAWWMFLQNSTDKRRWSLPLLQTVLSVLFLPHLSL